MAAKTRLGPTALPAVPYGPAGDNVMQDKPPSGVVEPEEGEGGTNTGPRRRIGVGKG